ncbi:MAG: hypothetical protein ABIL86_07605 [candidate division WOR-3 bacterium]
MKKLLCVVGGVILLVIGCGKGERASIMSHIAFYWDAPDSFVKTAEVEGYKYNGFKIIPVTTINEDTLYPKNYGFDPTYFYYEAYVNWIDEGEECKFKIDYDEGKGEATGTMPGEFRITSPDTTYVLHKGSALNITWNSSNGANWYWLDVYLDYYYVDTSGSWDSYYFELDTIVDGTSLTISASRIFPGYVDSVSWGYGEVFVEAINGPKPEPGAKSNIKGDAVGFFWCVYDAKLIRFGIGNLVAMPRANRQTEIRKRHYEVLREFALENE